MMANSSLVASRAEDAKVEKLDIRTHANQILISRVQRIVIAKVAPPPIGGENAGDVRPVVVYGRDIPRAVWDLQQWNEEARIDRPPIE